jgi:hypothetical protein
MLHEDYLLSKDAEKNRYLKHNNDVFDLKYQKFVQPILDFILNNHTCFEKGLDFGAGTGPVISKLLKDKDYITNLYDPFFHDNKDILNESYDYIVCCEVIEHFYNPYNEFLLLKRLLTTRGKIIIMTDIYSENIDFKNWYYKNDETHTFFYSETTLHWIKQEFTFNDLKIDKRLIVFN